jgi:hypothetical protein
VCVKVSDNPPDLPVKLYDIIHSSLNATAGLIYP